MLLLLLLKVFSYSFQVIKDFGVGFKYIVLIFVRKLCFGQQDGKEGSGFFFVLGYWVYFFIRSGLYKLFLNRDVDSGGDSQEESELDD